MGSGFARLLGAKGFEVAIGHLPANGMASDRR